MKILRLIYQNVHSPARLSIERYFGLYSGHLESTYFTPGST